MLYDPVWIWSVPRWFLGGLRSEFDCAVTNPNSPGGSPWLLSSAAAYNVHEFRKMHPGKGPIRDDLLHSALFLKFLLVPVFDVIGCGVSRELRCCPMLTG